ncbi:hypothetical protein LshimejAT787_1300510 [Lyophyllum shimeji]|uniref:Uncharacterized protein n=1 Tax=Lyophyllum shimeji TaxID=47721 RepID=A0A9P3UT29_LYOSH|nr:hypothetical protein LshimejAT787_1300510 [Lyophyllum shimeji]
MICKRQTPPSVFLKSSAPCERLYLYLRVQLIHVPDAHDDAHRMSATEIADLLPSLADSSVNHSATCSMTAVPLQIRHDQGDLLRFEPAALDAIFDIADLLIDVAYAQVKALHDCLRARILHQTRGNEDSCCDQRRDFD